MADARLTVLVEEGLAKAESVAGFAQDVFRPSLVCSVTGPPPHGYLAELADDADALLVIGDRRRSPRNIVPGPVVISSGGRAVPISWLPAVPGLAETTQRFAATRLRTMPASVAVCAQRSRRYRDLAARIEHLLDSDGTPTHRWTADYALLQDLTVGLGTGIAVAIYVGHGRAIGWAGYRGLRAHHLEGAEQPTGTIMSLTCLTASRRRVGLSFAEAVVTQGAAAASFGAVADTNHQENARWSLRVAQAISAAGIGAAPATIGEVIATAYTGSPASLQYRLIGDPLTPVANGVGALERADALSAQLAPPPDARLVQV